MQKENSYEKIHSLADNLISNIEFEFEFETLITTRLKNYQKCLERKAQINL